MYEKRQFLKFNQNFQHSFTNAKVKWENRESLILSIQREDGTVGYGEIAPTPGFKNFDMKVAAEEAVKWVKTGKKNDWVAINSALSCLDLEIWHPSWHPTKTKINSAELWMDGDYEIKENATVKKKIGLMPVQEEIKKLQDWIGSYPFEFSLRLDPNQSLSVDSLNRWIDSFYEEKRIQYIEEPLPNTQLDEMFEITHTSPINLALDESIIDFGGPMKIKEMGWEGYFILKPTLLEDWKQTILFIMANQESSVLSTVFESPFGFEALVRTCSYSLHDPGLSRYILQGNPLEFGEHHQTALMVPGVSVEKLNHLWNLQ